jgi:hypothetical protein
MFIATIAAAPRADAVTDAPAAVIISVRLVVAAIVPDAAFNSHAGYGAGTKRQKGCTEKTHHQSTTQGFHFGSALMSLSLHSIRPNGAPAGSATTASIPP